MNFPSNKARAILIDDEVIAIKNLKSLIENNCSEELDIVGMTSSTEEAELLIKAIKPQVLFLDIQLRNENAFQFLERLKPFTFEIIFVTAYDEYALRALKLSAVDYILKPISIDELKAAVEKLPRRLNTTARETREDYQALVKLHSKETYCDRVVLKNSTDLRVVLLKNLIYLEAKRSYSSFNFVNDNGRLESMLISKPISDYADLLPEDMFYRIHKSYLVNSDFISKFHLGNGQYHVELKDGTQLPLSRRKYAVLQEQFRKLPGNEISGKKR